GRTPFPPSRNSGSIRGSPVEATPQARCAGESVAAELLDCEIGHPGAGSGLKTGGLVGRCPADNKAGDSGGVGLDEPSRESAGRRRIQKDERQGADRRLVEGQLVAAAAALGMA